MLNVHLRINEDGRPVPCFVRLETAGTERFPLGYGVNDSERVISLEPTTQTVGYHFAAIDGGCEVSLPPGPVRVQAKRGPLYEPLDVVHTLAAGKLALRFALSRRADWRSRGWYSGDLRVHRLTPHGVLAQAAAEDLDFVQLLVRDGESLAAFSGDKPCLVQGETTVAVNTLNGDSVLGSVSMLNAHRPVFPLRADNPSWSVFDWCDQCHRKKGLVVWPDLPRLTEAHPQGEALAALVARKIDAVEVCSAESLELYHRLLNAGLRPALVGASGREGPETRVGVVRTYAQLLPDQEKGLASWMEAIRAGRTFVSTGPLLAITAVPGRVWRLRAESVLAEQVEILANGRAIATGTSTVEVEYVPMGTTWFAARCEGQSGFAHTSATWADVPGLPWRGNLDRGFLTALEATSGRIERPDVRSHLEDARRYLKGVGA